MIKGRKNQIPKISKSLKFFQKSLHLSFNTYTTNHSTKIVPQIIIIQVALASDIIRNDVNMVNFLTNPITIIQSHKLVNDENRNQTSNKPNNAKSTKAVILANAENQKNNQVIKIYLNKSLLSFEIFLF